MAAHRSNGALADEVMKMKKAMIATTNVANAITMMMTKVMTTSLQNLPKIYPN